MTADLAALRAVGRADVYKQGRRAATLTRTPDGVAFAYLPDWLQGGPPVASTLPLSATAVLRPGGALPAYFAGLLPEGRRLGALRRQVKTSADDELSLLLAVGQDAVGDVQVAPDGVPLAEVQPALAVADDFGAVSFRALLQRVGIAPDRVALPGVQDKVSAAMLNLPVARRGARFLLKLTPPEFPHLVENEDCFLRAARLAGLQVVEADLVRDRDGVAGLLVRRFDRLAGSPDLPPRALAVEDACQALGLPPGDKYRVTTEQAFGALTRLCGAPLPAARRLLAQAVFAYLSANGDAHAKNFSVLQPPSGEWAPSPAYDLPSSRPYDDVTLALTVNGRDDDLGVRDLLALGATLGLPERATRRVLAEQVERVDAWLPLVRELPFDPGRLRRLLAMITYRRSRLAGPG